ncbi:MAG: DegT/DnrJ/EryC1/StrS aminotransferase family protein [Candidatus Omnitrophica bacterium]|nr:DegT/DnrJ/EryC1/StrS aminotransferase family protein [Candidatus Omnitrophota bacterium]
MEKIGGIRNKLFYYERNIVNKKGGSMCSELAINGGTPVREKLIPINAPYFDQDDYKAVEMAMRSTFVSGDGPECRKFEEKLKKYLNVKYAFFTTSATAALDLAFMVKDFPEGSEVIVPDFTFTSTALAPILNQLKVVLVDVDPLNGNIDVGKIEAKITQKTAAIVPVDYAGNPADMDKINHLAKKYNLYVVHDAAQSIGSEYKGKKTGALADVSCFSFHGTKNLVVGEGGAIVTNHDDLAEKIIIAREKGTDKYSYISNPKKKGYYEYVSKGNSYVQSNILGALAVSQLKKIDFMNRRREDIAKRYMREFSELDGIGLPKVTEGSKTNWHLFYLLVPQNKKEWIIDALKAEGIMANIHYNPLHLNTYYMDLCDFEEDEFPNAMKFYDSLVRIPLYPSLMEKDVNDIVRGVRKVLGSL